MTSELTEKQTMFVREYLLDLNATQAAIRAGYSAKTAEQQGSRLLSNAKVAKAISEEKARRNERVQIDADYVLGRLVEVDQMDVLDIMEDDGGMKPISEWPRIWRQFIQGLDIAELFEGRGDEREMIGLLKKIKIPDKLKNLELLGKHVSVQAFRDKLELEGKVEIETYSDEELDERITRLVSTKASQ